MTRAFSAVRCGGAGLLRLRARLLGLMLRLGTLLRHLGMSLLRLLLGLRPLLGHLGAGLLLRLGTLLRLLLARLGLALLRLRARLLRSLGMFLLRLLSCALLLLALFRLGLTAIGLLLRRHLRALLLLCTLLLRVARLLPRLGALALLVLHLLTPVVRALGGQTLAGIALQLRLLLHDSLMLRRLTRLLLGEHLLSRRLLGIAIVPHLLLALLHLGDLHLALLLLLLLRTLLLQHLLLALLLGDLLLAGGIAIAAAEPATARRLVGRRDRLRRRAVEADLLPAIETLRLRLALRALVRPMLLLLGIMLGMIGLPFGLLRAIFGPLRPRRRDVRAPRRPVRGNDAAMFPLAGQAVQIDRAGIIARRIILPAIISVRRQQVAAIIIDRDELVTRIAVAVIPIAHEIGRVGTRLVIIIAVSAIDRLGILHVATVGLPCPGRYISVVIGIVRRRVADRVEHAVGAIEIGIGLRWLRDAGEFHRGGRRQSLCGGRGRDRSGGALLQRHRIGERGERAVGVGALVAGRG